MRIALVLGLGGLLVFSVGALIYLWRQAGIDIGLFGWLVIGAGAILSIALGVGLMALSFFSARHGYDDRAHEGERNERQ